jgi:serine/threonine-protein kinase
MAPEQLMGGVLDARVDQYALGTIAYEMLSGEMAFDGSGSVSDVARRVLLHVPPFVAGVSQAVNEVLFRAMARAADDRFASVDQLVRSLVLTSAVREPEAPPLKELPPLTGEATRVTPRRLDQAAEVARADEEDPPAPPPEDAAPRRAPPAATVAPPPILGGPTNPMPVVVSADEPTEEKPPLSGLSTMVVSSLRNGNGAGHAPPAEPRVTLKTMAAVTAGNAVTAAHGWEAVAGDRTHQTRAAGPWRLIGLGIVVGILVALAAVWALRG